MGPPPIVPIENTQYYFNRFLAEGVPQRVLEAALGMSREKLQSLSRISGRKVFEMLKIGIASTSPDMAIKLGAMASFEVTGFIGQIMRNCDDLNEASFQLIRFQKLLLGVARFEVREEGDCYVMIHRPIYPVCDDDWRMLTELNLSIPVSHARKLLNGDFSPREVRFSHPEPPYVDLYRQHFRCRLTFGAQEDALVIDKCQGDRKIPDAYSSMKNILIEYVEGLAAELESEIYFKDDVRRMIGELLPKGIADIEHVSRRLHMSRWTLTRRLKNEGTTFKTLLEGIRKEFALTYLKRETLTLAEIAFLLGYSETSAFQRAFKKWTGESPHRYLRAGGKKGKKNP